MKTFCKVVVASSIILFSLNAFAAKYIQGHTNKNGTYTQGHYLSYANSTRSDNLNKKTTGSNPYTSKKGQQRDEYSNPPQYNNSYNNGQGKQLNQVYGNPSK
jgi:hypothetical protein